jgi:hypothetical protein
MRCILIKDGKGPVDNLYMGEEETPEPAKGQVQVKIKVGDFWSRSRSRSNWALMKAPSAKPVHARVRPNGGWMGSSNAYMQRPGVAWC